MFCWIAGKAILIICFLLILLFILIPNYQLSLLLLVVIRILLLLGRKRIGQKIQYNHFVKEIKHWKILLSIFVICFFIRYIFCVTICRNIVPTSDFGVLFEVAETGDFLQYRFYYQMFPHKFFYPMLLHLLNLRNIESILLFQCFIVSIAAVLLYSIIYLYNRLILSILVCLIYISWPAQLLYTSVITEEHIALLTVLGFILVIDIQHKKMEKEDNYKSLIFSTMLAIWSGIIAAVNSLFKDWCSIIIIAEIIMAVLRIRKYKLKKCCIEGVFIIFLLLTQVCVKNVFMDFGESIIDAHINRNNIPCYMYVSLYPDSSGGYNEELYDNYFDIVRENDFNYSVANKTAMKELYIAIKESSLSNMLRLFKNKGIRAYANNDEIIDWTCAELTNENGFMHTYADLIKKVDRIYYVLIAGGIAVALMISLISKKVKYTEQVLFLALIIIGAMLISIFFIESQGRYKYGIEPVWLILLSIGWEISFEDKKVITRYEKGVGKNP